MLLDSGEDKNHVTTGGRGSAMAGSGGSGQEWEREWIFSKPLWGLSLNEIHRSRCYRGMNGVSWGLLGARRTMSVAGALGHHRHPRGYTEPQDLGNT